MDDVDRKLCSVQTPVIANGQIVYIWTKIRSRFLANRAKGRQRPVRHCYSFAHSIVKSGIGSNSCARRFLCNFRIFVYCLGRRRNRNVVPEHLSIFNFIFTLHIRLNNRAGKSLIRTLIFHCTVIFYFFILSMSTRGS